jgi:DNA-binding NarL/FixJ family response regulator
MPGMDGHRCLRALLSINPSGKIIIASGYAVHGQVKETIEAGAAAYIGKPYRAVELLKKVRAVLDGGD